MKQSKSFLKSIFLLSISLLTAFIFTMTSYAFSESEYNDSINNANTIKVNEIVYASFDSSRYEDEDNYKFAIPKDGTITLTMNHEYLDLGVTMQYYFSLDGTVNTILSSSDLRWNAETQTTKKLGLRAGTYYLHFHDWADDRDIPYNFIINYTETNGYEKEPDGNIKNATVIPVNTEIGGTLWRNDRDMLKLTIPSDGAFSLTYKKPYDMDYSTSIRLFSYNGTDEESFYSDYFDGDSEIMTTPQLGLKAGDYYVELSCGTDNFFEYSITANFKPSEYWEKENNSNLITASPMKTDVIYHGSISTYETDWFEFNLENDGYITIEFSHNYFTNNFDTELALVLYDGTSEHSYGTYTFGSNSQNSITDRVFLSKGKYLIHINTCSSSYFEYGIMVTTDSEPETEITEPEDETEATSEFETDNFVSDSDEAEIINHNATGKNKITAIVIALSALVALAIIAAIVVAIIDKNRKSF